MASMDFSEYEIRRYFKLTYEGRQRELLHEIEDCRIGLVFLGILALLAGILIMTDNVLNLANVLDDYIGGCIGIILIGSSIVLFKKISILYKKNCELEGDDCVSIIGYLLNCDRRTFVDLYLKATRREEELTKKARSRT